MANNSILKKENPCGKNPVMNPEKKYIFIKRAHKKKYENCSYLPEVKCNALNAI